MFWKAVRLVGASGKQRLVKPAGSGMVSTCLQFSMVGGARDTRHVDGSPDRVQGKVE
jgi:hypothetical protein